tara:strand:+ start:1003 stop:1485 length:483 start_codon:yes stop_codon:yes gene_type:complete
MKAATHSITKPALPQIIHFVERRINITQLTNMTDIAVIFASLGMTPCCFQFCKNAPNIGWLYNHERRRSELWEKAQRAIKRKIVVGIPGITTPTAANPTFSQPNPIRRNFTRGLTWKPSRVDKALFNVSFWSRLRNIVLRKPPTLCNIVAEETITQEQFF